MYIQLDLPISNHPINTTLSRKATGVVVKFEPEKITMAVTITTLDGDGNPIKSKLFHQHALNSPDVQPRILRSDKTTNVYKYELDTGATVKYASPSNYVIDTGDWVYEEDGVTPKTDIRFSDNGITMSEVELLYTKSIADIKTAMGIDDTASFEIMIQGYVQQFILQADAVKRYDVNPD